MLTFIRHTSVDFPQGVCYGATDVPVAESFFDEAEVVKGKLCDLSFDEVWSSPLSRCTQLSDSLFGLHNYKTDERIRELNFGDWEKVPWKNIYNLEYGKHWMNNFATVRCPNGESFMEQIDRIKEFYAEKIKEAESKNIVIVTHAGVIRAFMCFFQGITPMEAFDIKVEYGSVCRYSVQTKCLEIETS